MSAPFDPTGGAPATPFDQFLTHLSEYLDPIIVAGHIEEIEGMYWDGRDRAYIVSKVTEWVLTVLHPDDLLGGYREWPSQ